MDISENKQHDLLLAITSILFILFTTGLAVPTETQANPIVIPSA